jgi:hypothetical protein
MASVLNQYFSSVFTDEGDGPVPAAEQNRVESPLEDVVATEKGQEKNSEPKTGLSPRARWTGLITTKRID